jgi:hypothetical protein
MGVLGHLVKLLSALFLGLIVPYVLYRALSPLDAFLASFLALGLMASLPLVLILVFYGRLQWAKYLFIFIWLAYTAGMWMYMFVSMSAAFPGYFWVPALAILAGGAVFLLVFLRKREVDFSQLLHRGREELEAEELDEETGEGEEFKVEEHEPVEGDKGLPILIGSLNDVQCRILMTLVESRRQYSKKDLHRIVKATYPRTLRAVDGLKELGLVEVVELPRRAKGAPVLHAVKVSRSIIGEEARVKDLVRKRLMELEEASPRL